MPNGFYALILCQWMSALADNALLLLVIALLQLQGYPAFWIPLLKLFFTVSYVLFGPWVGALADTWSKHHLLQRANALKLFACLGLLAGIHPLVAFALTGLGAAVYSPAKYGWITEMVETDQLLKANGWLEVTTVCAILLGVMLGGLLVSDHWLSLGWVQTWVDWIDTGNPLSASMAVICLMYVLSALMTFGVPSSNKHYASTQWDIPHIWRNFCEDQRQLWRDPLGFVSLSITTLFWGVSACMQLLVLAWAQSMLQLSLSQAAYLQACTAIGVVAGAIAAGRWMQLNNATAVLGAGVAIGVLLPLMLLIKDWNFALALTLLLGGLGGFLVVPMNALLQARGVLLLSAGRSISVQNTCENLSILLMLGVYSFLTYIECSLSTVVMGLATVVALGTGCLMIKHAKDNSSPFKSSASGSR